MTMRPPGSAQHLQHPTGCSGGAGGGGVLCSAPRPGAAASARLHGSSGRAGAARRVAGALPPAAVHRPHPGAAGVWPGVAQCRGGGTPQVGDSCWACGGLVVAGGGAEMHPCVTTPEPVPAPCKSTPYLSDSPLSLTVSGSAVAITSPDMPSCIVSHEALKHCPVLNTCASPPAQGCAVQAVAADADLPSRAQAGHGGHAAPVLGSPPHRGGRQGGRRGAAPAGGAAADRPAALHWHHPTGQVGGPWRWRCMLCVLAAWQPMWAPLLDTVLEQ